jgi:FkbM family methyltransferase
MKKKILKAAFWFRNFFRKSKFIVKSLSLYADSYKSASFLYDEIFVEDYYDCDLPQKSDLVIIDAGANMGWASAFFKNKYPNSQIIAFEPNPDVADIYIKNIKQNNFSKVELIQKALFDKDDSEIEFYISKRHGSFRSSIYSERGGRESVKVKTMKLSTYLKKLEKVDLLKIDVEGAENLIIEDLKNSNSLLKIDNIIIEIHHNPNKNLLLLSNVFKLLEENNFIFNIRAYHKNFPVFQDIVIKAKRKIK